jgi:hypothetical protein
MKNESCFSCGKSKALLNCGLCQTVVCKYCAQFLEEDRAPYLTPVPTELSHTVYCYPCYTEQVAPVLEDYDEQLKAAKNIMIFSKAQNKETHFIKRIEEPLVITDCDSEADVLMKMAFIALKLEYNAIIDVTTNSKKVKIGSYQTTKWSGTGIPTDVQDSKLMKDRSFIKRPN